MLITFPQCNFTSKFPEIHSQNFMGSLTECSWQFQNNALWDIIKHAPVHTTPYLYSLHHSSTVACLSCIDLSSLFTLSAILRDSCEPSGLSADCCCFSDLSNSSNCAAALCYIIIARKYKNSTFCHALSITK